MHVLVTGGAGYIGSHTVVELLNVGHTVVVLDNFSNSSPAVIQKLEKISGKKVPVAAVDLLDYDKLEDVIKTNTFDACIHFAGLKAVGESCEIPLRYYHNNITGTLNLCTLLAKYNVKKFVFSSSATVYGDPARVPITEDFPLTATNPYGQTKLTIEYILKDLYTSDKEWDIAILRYFNPIGAHSSGLIGDSPNGIPNNLLPYVSQVAAKKLEQLPVFGNDYDTIDGTGVRDYIHVVDLAQGHLLALEKLEKKSGVVIYNLGTGSGYSVLQIVDAFKKASGRDVPVKICPRRPGDAAKCYADPSKAKQELGFTAKYSIEQMCKDAWNYESSTINNLKE